MPRRSGYVHLFAGSLDHTLIYACRLVSAAGTVGHKESRAQDVISFPSLPFHSVSPRMQSLPFDAVFTLQIERMKLHYNLDEGLIFYPLLLRGNRLEEFFFFPLSFFFLIEYYISQKCKQLVV